jgi:hypothetical protein
MMTDQPRNQEFLWEVGWTGHEKAQLLRMARLSFREKIKWLEGAQELVQSLERRRHAEDHRNSEGA